MSSSNELITKLDGLGCITFSGPQATEYLQGQVTIDVTKMTTEQARFGAHCDFKGKTWSVFTAFLNNDNYHLVMQMSALETSLAQFKKYGVFSKVEIQSASPELVFYGVSGSLSYAKAKDIFPNINQEHLSVVNNEFGSAICINMQESRYILALNAKGASVFDEYIEPNNNATQAMWEALDIRDGIPHIVAQTSNEFVPQMLNLQALNGIDFDKGCYMGQETVARTKFLGRNKRAAYILENKQNDMSFEIAAGAALEKKAGENWRSGGTVLQSASTGGNTVLLSVLANDTQTGDVLRLKESPEYEFEVSALPYKLD